MATKSKPLNRQHHDLVDTIESAEWCEIPDEDESKEAPPKKVHTLKRKASAHSVTGSVTRAKRSATLNNSIDTTNNDDAEEIFIEIDELPNALQVDTTIHPDFVTPTKKCRDSPTTPSPPPPRPDILSEAKPSNLNLDTFNRRGAKYKESVEQKPKWTAAIKPRHETGFAYVKRTKGLRFAKAYMQPTAAAVERWKDHPDADDSPDEAQRRKYRPYIEKIVSPLPKPPTPIEPVIEQVAKTSSPISTDGKRAQTVDTTTRQYAKVSVVDHQPKQPPIPQAEELPTQTINQSATAGAAPAATSDSSESKRTSGNLTKLEHVIERCVQLVEKCIAQNSHQQDTNQIFGNCVSAMLRELPPNKRNVARVELLQFTGDLIARLSDEST